jgi:hypothetical protein
MDSSINQIEKGQLSYALNASVENFDSNSVSYQNEPGNELCLNFPEGYVLIGKHYISEKNKHIFFLANEGDLKSEIGYMDNNDCVYRSLVNADCLNFNVNYPIHKVVHKITDCDTEIYWTDGLNNRRFLNIDNIPWVTVFEGDICDIVTENGVLDCNKIEIQPNFEIPELNPIEVLTGGELKAGTYQFAVQYCNASGIGYTSYYSVTNPLPIANPDITTLSFDYVVGRSINLKITNLDVTGYFKYYNVAVIKTINAITSVELVGTYFIDGAENTIYYTGQNSTDIRLAIADIFEKFPYYDVAQDVTAVQDVLVWTGLTTFDKVSYQKIANQIALQWETYRVPPTKNYSDEILATKYKGYLRDEVYAFEIVFLLNNGKQTDGFHIPGRAYTPSDITKVYKTGPAATPDFIGEATNEEPITFFKYSPKWKIYNTASIIGYVPGYSTASTYEGPWEYGNFSFWESVEEYPCNTDVWGALAGQKIRHHKFPDVNVTPIFETSFLDYNNPQIQNKAILPIGVKISIQQVEQLIAASTDLTPDQKASIVGFKIVRGDRSNNKSIVGKGMLRNVGIYTRDSTTNPTNYYYPNYPFNDLRDDPFLLKQNNAYNSQAIRFQITSVTAGVTIQYTDVYTGEYTSTIVAEADVPFDLCSLTTPTTVSEGVTILNLTSKSYTVTVQIERNFLGPTRTSADFGYTPPGSTTEIEINIHYSASPKTLNSTTVPRWIRGSRNYTVSVGATISNDDCYPQPFNGFNTDASKYRMVFNSPETSFGQPYLGNILKLESVMFGRGKGHFVKVEKHANYKLLTLDVQQQALDSSYKIARGTEADFDPTAMFTAYQAYLQIYLNGVSRQNYAYSFNSIGSYDYSTSVPNSQGVKQRELDIYQYLIPGVQSVGDDNNINNWNRESSVYVKTKSTLTPLPFAERSPNIVNPSGGSYIADSTRFTISTAPTFTGQGTCGDPEQQVDSTVIAYYASLKNLFIGQWGQVYSYDTIDTGFQVIFDTSSAVTGTVFGGDTFIGKFAYKTKLPFFIDNRVGAPDDSDIYYDELGNVAYPQYWYSARSILNNYTVKEASLANAISYKAHYFDCPINTPIYSTTTTTTTQAVATGTSSTISTVNQSAVYQGKMYLFAYGIPFFYVESSINVDLRQAFNTEEGDFYPHVSSGTPDNWLQESVVSIAQDNTYYYNVTYSKQNKENFFSHLPIDWTPDECATNFPFRSIYSDTQNSDPNANVNNWLVYRPLSRFDFPQNYGDLISLDGIQNKAILARFENKTFMYNNLLTINTSNPQAAYVGNPNMFSAPPIDFAETDLGYVGSQNKMLLKIPQGQITIDAKRGQVFLVNGTQAQDLSAFGSGMNRFFTDHLAFEILRYYPQVNTDNNYNGVGLHGVFDSKFDRVIITKRDYIPQPTATGLLYDVDLQKFYINRTVGGTTYKQFIPFTDTTYFCNKSWTLSFNFNTRTWTSFHSYIPNYYIAENNFFYSGLSDSCNLEARAMIELPATTSTTTSTSTSTTSTTSTTSSTSTTTTTTTAAATISINTSDPVCRENNCNDNALCAVRFAITTTNAPAGSYITIYPLVSPGSTATLTLLDNSPSSGLLKYSEPSGTAAINFELELRDSLGNFITSTGPKSISHQSYWSMEPLCSAAPTTTTTTTEGPVFTILAYAFGGGDPDLACEKFELGQTTNMYVLESEVPIGLNDHLYSIPNLANPAPAGYYARGADPVISTYQVTGSYGEITSVDPCGTIIVTTTTTTAVPTPTYVSIPAPDYAYNTSNAANVGVCCTGSALYTDGSGNFVFTETSGYELVTQFWVDDNGGTYFNTATVMYVYNGSTFFPVPAGYYGSQPIGYRGIAGTAGQFTTQLTTCAGVACN